MATSTFKGYVRHSAGQLTDNSAFGASQARDHLVNNANHIADSAGQVLINWSMTTASTYMTPDLSAGSLAAADTYYRFSPFGPFPLLVKGDGSSYQLRIRLAGYSAAAGTVTFRVVVSALAEALAARETSTATNAATFSTTATTNGWRDAATDNLVSLTPDDLFRTMTTLSTLDAVAGAAVSVRVPLAYVTVYGKGSVTAAVPRLTGLYLAEYIGT